jgi:stage II sporulation protein AA (anti-sigma F factor antagonist)
MREKTGGRTMEKLNFECVSHEDELVISLYGTVDHHTLRDVREKLDSAIFRCRAKTVILDLGGVEFMDSAGLGLIMGRYTRITDLGGKLVLREVSGEILKILRLAGLDKFIPIEKNEKKTAMKG